MKRILFLSVFIIFYPSSAWASNKVGNGDDGTDLEGLRPVTEGPLEDAREKAVQLLDRLNTAGIPGLGALRPEVARADLFLANEDVAAKLPADQGTFHSAMNGLVYARTLPSPHAATRFFPVATGLPESQLIALNIHEGLHRALPPSVREEESVVGAITLALTSPGANYDEAKETVARYVSQADLELPEVGTVRGGAGSPSGETLGTGVEEVEHFKQPSNINYAYRYFFKPNQPAVYPITSMHVLESDLYPFGGTNTPFGLGIRASMIDGPMGLQSGPLGVSANLKVWSRRDFSISIWGQGDWNVLSADELKNSPFGRDVYSLGVCLRKDLSRFYVENYLSFDFPGQSNQTIGLVNYTYDYGSVIEAKVRAGVRVWKVDVGAFGEIHLADYFRVSGGAFSPADGDLGRYRIFSAGPEVTYATPDFSVSLLARFLVDSTKGANFDYLGNIMGPGVSQGSIGVSGKVFF